MSTFAHLVKKQGRDDDSETERPYSPRGTVRSTVHRVTGRPDTAHVSMSYVERHNLSLWMAVRRLMWLTNPYSKPLIEINTPPPGPRAPYRRREQAVDRDQVSDQGSRSPHRAWCTERGG